MEKKQTIIEISEDQLTAPGFVIEAQETPDALGLEGAPGPEISPAAEPEAVLPETAPGDEGAVDVEKNEDLVEFEANMTPDEFVEYMQQYLKRVPAWTRDNLLSIERAISYYEKGEKTIAGTIKADLDGDFGPEHLGKIQDLRNYIMDQKRVLERIRSSLEKAFSRRSDFQAGLTKEATTPILTTVPDYFCYSIARAIGNAVASGGQDIDDMFKIASDKFQMDDREKFMVRQVLYDMGRVIHAPLIPEIPFKPDNYLA